MVTNIIGAEDTHFMYRNDIVYATFRIPRVDIRERRVANTIRVRGYTLAPV